MSRRVGRNAECGRVLTSCLLSFFPHAQYFTWADRMGNSYRQPKSELDPMLEVKALEAKKQKAALGKEQ